MRVAIITGGANGLGLACAKRLGQDGVHIHLVDADKSTLSAAVDQLNYMEIATTATCADIRTQARCHQTVSEVGVLFDRVDILVNCAGVYPRAPILEITEQQWHLDFDVNVLGTYFMMVEVIKLMKAQNRGYIVNVSSIDAFTAHPDNAHYAATKAAVVSLTRSFALALAPFGILINSVAPGPMATDKAKQSDWYGEMVMELPTGISIEPDEVSNLIAYLSREENTSITGENILISGGGVIA